MVPAGRHQAQVLVTVCRIIVRDDVKFKRQLKVFVCPAGIVRKDVEDRLLSGLAGNVVSGAAIVVQRQGAMNGIPSRECGAGL